VFIGVGLMLFAALARAGGCLFGSRRRFQMWNFG
jgi:hypothetical protein